MCGGRWRSPSRRCARASTGSPRRWSGFAGRGRNVEARPHAVVSRQGADLFERIRSGSGHFTPSFRKVAEYVISHPHEVAFLPAAKVAAGPQVSESVVVRFAGALGYPGYPAMQQAAQAFVRSQLSPSQRFESLRITRSSTSADIFRSVFLQDIGNLRATVEHG